MIKDAMMQCNKKLSSKNYKKLEKSRKKQQQKNAT